MRVQVASERHFEKRATFYVTKTHTQQIADGEEYAMIAPTVSIWLVDHVRFPERDNLHSTYLLREREHGDVLTEDLQIHFIELPKFGKHEVNELGTPVEKWLHMLRFAQEYARGRGRLPEKLRAEEGVAMAFDKMQHAQSDEEVRSWVESREKFRRDVATRLANAREDGVEEGRQLGVEEGRQLGVEEGRPLGNLDGRRETALRMLAKGYDPAEVARMTDLTEAEVKTLHNS